MVVSVVLYKLQTLLLSAVKQEQWLVFLRR